MHIERDAASILEPRPCGSNPPWFVVVSHPHAEPRAARELGNQGFPAYLPLVRERSGRIGPLFVRYLFVAFDPNTAPWGCILNTRGVLTLIRHAPNRPTPVAAGVVENLIQRTSPRGIVDDPGDAPPHLRRGTPVTVTDGPLAGLAGIVELSAADRVALLVQILGRQVRMTVERRSLAAA